MKLIMNFTPNITASPKFPSAVMSGNVTEQIKNDFDDQSSSVSLILGTAPEETAVIAVILAAVRAKLAAKEE